MWRRRASNSSALREVLSELLAVLATADTPRGAATLWTGSVDAAMGNLLEELAAVPDQWLQRHVTELHQCLVSIRGMASPTNDDLLGPGVNLTGDQRRLLSEARGAASAAVGRINLAIRKGGRQ